MYSNVLVIICLFLQIPHALWNILLEKSVKVKKTGAIESLEDYQRLNMAYVLFWNFLGTFLGALCLFWLDLIPGFGLLPDIKLFPQQ